MEVSAKTQIFLPTFLFSFTTLGKSKLSISTRFAVIELISPEMFVNLEKDLSFDLQEKVAFGKFIEA